MARLFNNAVGVSGKLTSTVFVWNDPMLLRINGTAYQVPEEWQEEPLLTVIRDYLGLTGTKFGCGKGLCGACTIHINGEAIRSCMISPSSVENAKLTTIEGLAQQGELHPVQQAWIEESVAQCGYCQSGQIMAAAAFLNRIPNPTSDQIMQAMRNNLCRCGTYNRIRLAVTKAASRMQDAD